MTRLPSYYQGREAFAKVIFDKEKGLWQNLPNPYGKDSLQFKEFEAGFNDAYVENLNAK